MMKTIKYIIAALMVLPLMVACADDDYQNIVKQGSPQMDIAHIGKTLMGDVVDVTVACSDAKGTALSTLKAEMMYSGETVDETVIRTKEAGNYQVQLTAPFLQYIPNGKATVRLTLQNVTTSTTIIDVDFDVERPHFTDLQFITEEGVTYDMTEQEDYDYTATVPVSSNGFKGHFLTKDGRWVFGNGGAEVALGQTAELDFQSAETGDVMVTLNTRDFTYGPVEDIPVIPFNLADGETATRQMVQGNLYSFGGVIDESYYIDPDFFENNEDGTYTFLAASGNYTVKAYAAYQYVQVWPANADGSPAALQADGTGSIWVIGGEGINKPNLSAANNHGWWTDPDWDICMAPVAEKVYQMTLTVGQQLKADDVNFKFFGQPNWGTEFHADGDYALTTDNPWFYVGPNDGNIYLNDGVTLADGDTYTFTIDLTAGTANGKLTVKKSTGGANSIDLSEGKATLKLKKGTAYTLDGVDADYFVDYDFFKDAGDGTYVFQAISGTYTVQAYADYKYVQVYPSDADGNVSTLQADGTGSVWIIGSECINKPNLASGNNNGWWTDPVWNICLAPIADKKYQVTLTVGQQLSTGDINFKFFGQPTWGTEFNGLGGDYHLDTDNEWFRVNAADSDNGNIFLKDGATLNDGDTYVFTIDLTGGVSNGVLTVDKK